MRYEDISKYVDEHRDEAVKFLQQLVRIPSPTGQEEEVALCIGKKLTDEGLEVQYPTMVPHRPNLLCEWKGGKGKTLLFSGHMDVFPPEGSPSRDPWSGEIEGDRLYARGSTDMKAGDAAGTLAMVFLKRMGFTPKGTMALGLNCDEEQGSKAGLLYCISQGLFKADLAIVMEASEDTIIVNTDGRIAWKVTIHSDGWHAGTRVPGKVDSLQMAHELIGKIYDYDRMLFKERYFGGREFGASIAVTGVSAGFEGRTVNMHPATTTIWIDRRYTKGETIESATKELKDMIESVPGVAGRYELEELYSCGKIEIDPNDPDILACMEDYRTVFKSPIRPGRRNGGGDAVKLQLLNDTRAPQLGPGLYDVLGSDDEYVSIEQYIGYIKLYMLITSHYLA